MTPVREEAQRLLRLAKSDHDAFLRFLNGPGLRPLRHSSSLNRRSEVLKAVMTACDLVPTRTHNLLAPAAELTAVGILAPHSPDEFAVHTDVVRRLYAKQSESCPLL